MVTVPPAGSSGEKIYIKMPEAIVWMFSMSSRYRTNHGIDLQEDIQSIPWEKLSSRQDSEMPWIAVDR